MARVTSGSILRATRERKGYDLVTVARRLRIRPDILRAIEENDFSAMPPRGYTRNMVNAYARLLRLNPTEIVNKYLDEAQAYQMSRSNSSTFSTPAWPDFDMGAASRRSSRARERLQERTAKRDESQDPTKHDNRHGLYSNQVKKSSLGRDLYDDRIEYARDDYGVGLSDKSRSNHWRSRERTYDHSFKPYQPQRSSLPNNQYASFYSRAKPASMVQSRLPFIIGGVVLIVLIIIVLSFALGNHKEEDVATLPVTGISDTTGGEAASTSSTSESQNEAPPANVQVTYAVTKAGATCYVEIYTDSDLTTATMLTGPMEETVSVEGVWTITTWSPDVLTLTVDGEEVELVSDETYGGMYAYTVDYPAVLEAWKTAHPTAGGEANDTNNNSATTAEIAPNNGTGTEAGTSSSTAAANTSQNTLSAFGASLVTLQ